ncbi:MAG: nucleotidyl transferase AbiEii/AbiGii toxin family protein [Bacteroidetes bacterium]|nr:nucleotidyl transferase AbiEii/AbiGii toxin family protein [Bacteroidota bacterium]
MAESYLHNHKDFSDLLNILADKNNILPGLIEKDYWIMHVLYGLKKQGLDFELKGGTSLSKGYKIIDRFSEDIDIHIKPPAALGVEENPAKTKPSHIESRKKYYDWLAQNIKIDGVVSVKRDTAFDDEAYYRSGGIRLLYESRTESIEGVKEGILLEAGFDTVTPNSNLTISSWAYDEAAGNSSIKINDNRAVGITCYHPGYTFVEKLQTIATKFRQEQEDNTERPNYMRQYYDVACLLKNELVQQFIDTEEYKVHKKKRFPAKDFAIPVAENQAFLLSDAALRDAFKKRYEKTNKLYYKGQMAFDEIMSIIQANIGKL